MSMEKNGGNFDYALEDSHASDMKGFVVKSRSPMLKPALIPTGKIIRGIFTKLITCVSALEKDGTKKPGNLIEIVKEGNQIGVAIPLTAVLANALEVTGKGDEAESKWLGHEIAIERLADKIPSKQGQDAWNFIVAIKE